MKNLPVMRLLAELRDMNFKKIKGEGYDPIIHKN